MTKAEEHQLQELARRQGFETLASAELKELSRLAAKKAKELKTATPQKRKKTTRTSR